MCPDRIRGVPGGSAAVVDRGVPIDVPRVLIPGTSTDRAVLVDVSIGSAVGRLLMVLLGAGLLVACDDIVTGTSGPAAVRETVTGAPGAQLAPSPCPVTTPGAPFTPSDRPAAPARPPVSYDAAWYGDDSLFTVIDREEERWHDLPAGPRGFGQKTFWWSADFDPGREFTPSISVAGERLDATGRFVAPGTGSNATADFGSAMLIAVDIPSAGCWRLTARYREADLSILVWVAD